MSRNLALLGTIAAAGLALSGQTLHAQVAVNQSFSACTSMLCLDAPPQGPKGLDGSSGWGYNAKANAPVSILYVNKPATFTVTVMQPSSLPFCGSATPLTITLTYSSQDFSLSMTDSSGNAGVNPFDRGGVSTFTYGGSFLCHADQSVAFTFTPQNPTFTALVTASVAVAGQQASETFPVAIAKKEAH